MMKPSISPKSSSSRPPQVESEKSPGCSIGTLQHNAECSFSRAQIWARPVIMEPSLSLLVPKLGHDRSSWNPFFIIGTPLGSSATCVHSSLPRHRVLTLVGVKSLVTLGSSFAFSRFYPTHTRTNGPMR